MPTTNIEVIIGTYEEFLLGYKVELKSEKQTLKQSFADKSHSGAIKCVAVQGHWIASGGTDDRIFIYDMRQRKQSQIILSHEGTVNALAFTPDQTHILSGGDDGRMLATRINTWQAEANWRKAHSGAPVTHIACHPSGKLALSLGTDLVLRTWNLVKGRVAYKTNLKSRNTLGTLPECLAWTPNGEHFTLSGQRVLEIWSIKTADVVRSITTKSKPICIAWLTDELGLLGLEDGKLMWITVDEQQTKQQTSELVEAHNGRVKAISYYQNILVTASSAGEIKIWQITDLAERKLKEISSTNIGCRPTCISILDLAQFGENYLLNRKIIEPKTKIEEPKPIKQLMPRGVVTIEYEDDDDAGLEPDSDDDDDDDDDDGVELEAAGNDVITQNTDDSESDDSDELADSSDDDDAAQVAQLSKPKVSKRQKSSHTQKAVPVKKLKTNIKKLKPKAAESSSKKINKKNNKKIKQK